MRKILNNYYPKNKSWFECFGKEIRYSFRALKSFFSYGKIKRILAYPELPGSRAIITKIALHKKWIITNNPKKKVIFAIFWKDDTLRNVPDKLKELSSKMPVLNLYNDNILKTYIEEFFYETFGYRTRVDPQLHQGKAVCKSEYNATHSGTIVDCPVDVPEKDCIYQVIIHNRTAEGCFEDISVPVIGRTIPFVYIKLKEENARFETRAQKVFLEETEKYISKEEQEKILKFASFIGLDFGEIDVLRNRTDSKLYIVDVNNTPYGPPANLPGSDAKYAIQMLAEKLVELLKKKKEYRIKVL